MKLSKLAFLFIAIFTFVCTGCTGIVHMLDSFRAQYAVSEKNSGKVSSYLLSITNCEAISLDVVTQWIEGCASSDGYYEYVYADPDSWDVFLYMPNAQKAFGDIQNNNVAIAIEDSVLKIYITTGEELPHEKASDQLILHIKAPDRGAWPSSTELYIDEKEVTLVDTESAVENN